METCEYRRPSCPWQCLSPEANEPTHAVAACPIQPFQTHQVSWPWTVFTGVPVDRYVTFYRRKMAWYTSEKWALEVTSGLR